MVFMQYNQKVIFVFWLVRKRKNCNSVHMLCWQHRQNRAHRAAQLDRVAWAVGCVPNLCYAYSILARLLIRQFSKRGDAFSMHSLCEKEKRIATCYCAQLPSIVRWNWCWRATLLLIAQHSGCRLSPHQQARQGQQTTFW